MEPNETYREANRRRHRLLGSYLALYAWEKKVDCVVLVRDQLVPFLEMGSLPESRIKWVIDDVYKLFPFHSVVWDNKGKKVEALYLSRQQIPANAWQNGLSTEEYVEALKNAGLNTKIAKVPAESEIIRVMAFISHGIWNYSKNTGR
jgi:hypothetical protein